jgi:hypothetical protein
MINTGGSPQIGDAAGDLDDFVEGHDRRHSHMLGTRTSRRSMLKIADKI